MHVARFLNHYKLFQGVAGWREKNNSVQLDTFLFRGTSAAIHVRRLEELQSRCVAELETFLDQMTIGRPRIVVSSPTLVELLNEISPLLTTMRILQDSLLPLVGQQLSISVPKSMNDAIKKLHRYAVPDPIKKRTLSYWNSSGKSVRDYRVLDQHYGALVNHTFYELVPHPRVVVLFPDDPTVHGSAKFTYSRGVDGLAFLNEAWQQLHSYIEDVAGLLGFQTMGHKEEIRMEQLGVIQPPVRGALGLMIDHVITQSSGGRMMPHLTAIEISQLEDGRLSVRKLSMDATP